MTTERTPMPPPERRSLLQVGPSTWISLVDIIAINWDDTDCCPRITLTAGGSFLAPLFSQSGGLGDTPELGTGALMSLIRTASKRKAALISAKSLLTTRETEVLEALARGETNTALARKLYMSESTVKSHEVHIYSKLGVKNRTAAVMAGIHLGIIDSDPQADPPGDGPAGGRY